MSEVANLHDNGPISPMAKIKENLALWTEGGWEFNRIEYIEPLPLSSPMVVEVITAAPAWGTTLAANGTIAKRVVAILQPAKNELLHLRWFPIDDVEGVLWEKASKGRFVARQVQARVTRFSGLYDPFLATTTFWVIGENRDMNLEVRNPNPVIIASARFAFFGYRYILEKLTTQPGTATYLPCEGR